MIRVLLRALLAVALFAPLQAQASEPGSARAFVEGLYRAYGHGEPDFFGKMATKTFAPHLLSLIRRDEAAAHGEVGALDYDPICSCQDSGGMKVERIEVKPSGRDRAVADVSLRYPDAPIVVKLDLVSLHGRWLIADIHTKDTPSLVAYLEENVPGAGARTKPRR